MTHHGDSPSKSVSQEEMNKALKERKARHEAARDKSGDSNSGCLGILGFAFVVLLGG